jgi:hypothetical protein
VTWHQRPDVGRQHLDPLHLHPRRGSLPAVDASFAWAGELLLQFALHAQGSDLWPRYQVPFTTAHRASCCSFWSTSANSAACHAFDTTHAGCDTGFGTISKPMSPVRVTWVPPIPRRSHSPIDSTRTSSPFFRRTMPSLRMQWLLHGHQPGLHCGVSESVRLPGFLLFQLPRHARDGKISAGAESQ